MPTPYIFFDGCCRDAMTFYADVFGGAPDMMAWSDAPPGTVQQIDSDRIMHAWLQFPDGTGLMASDRPSSAPSQPQQSVSISHAVPDPTVGQAVFDRLAEDGTVLDSYKPAFFSAGFGVVKDRFGTTWMVHAPPDDAAG